MDVAALTLEVRTDSLKQATAELRELPKAASAAERAAQKWSRSTQDAARSTDDFSKRVRNTIRDLEFERAQLARSATERQRYAALRRAGVAEMSAEGQAILASVRALQAQRAAIQSSTEAQQRMLERGFDPQGGGCLHAIRQSVEVAVVAAGDMEDVQRRLFGATSERGRPVEGSASPQAAFHSPTETSHTRRWSGSRPGLLGKSPPQPSPSAVPVQSQLILAVKFFDQSTNADQTTLQTVPPFSVNGLKT
jgi:hypothetical protein